MVQELLDRSLPLEWVVAQLVADEPGKALGKAEASELLSTRLKQAIGEPERQLDIVSPYFVPGKEGTAALSAYPARGVDLRILTNSLAATDVGAVHAGYAKRRKDLLRSGVRLYELKPDAGDPGAGTQPAGKREIFRGSSAASLHAKSMASDRQRLFIGSFNLDLRSVMLNTEMGLVIESPRQAARLSGWLDDRMPRAAYEVRLAGDGQGLEWVERTDRGEVVYTSEPKTGFFKRMGIGFLSWFPIDWML
jgi:putative cardiolipin synthase